MAHAVTQLVDARTATLDARITAERRVFRRHLAALWLALIVVGILGVIF